MDVRRSEDGWVVSRTSGPRHNLLDLVLSDDATETPRIEALPPIGACEHEPLHESSIVAAVQEGVALANAQCGTRFGVARIRYVVNDTRPELVYGAMAAAIVTHAAQAGR